MMEIRKHQAGKPSNKTNDNSTLFLYNSDLTKCILPARKDVWTCRDRRTKYDVLALGPERIWSSSCNRENYWRHF
jgi:hypothetical protein